MHIPHQLRSRVEAPGAAPPSPARWILPSSAEAASPPGAFRPVLLDAVHRIAGFFTVAADGATSLGPELRRRDGLQDQNTTIGIIVGVVLAVFLVSVVLFLYRYRFSIQFTHKKKRRSRSGSSKSSKASASSASSDGGAAPAG